MCSVDFTGVACIFVGEYFADCKIRTPNKLALDEEAVENLWKRSEEWTRL